ncbi:hypothetical protein APHAL10511_003926 [Amanita phalloides]|nr:hypothetical protein APHAL10511_003926 [Amanita phalloides]
MEVDVVRPPDISSPAIPSVDDIRIKAHTIFQKRPCLWQINVCQAVLAGNQDIMSIAGTGAGKTLSFWLPLLCRPNGIQIVVTPLNILGQQNIDTYPRLGNFEDIADLKYRVIVANPEELMRPGGRFESLFKKKSFVDNIISIIIDEAHCVSQWGSFRPEYRHIGALRHLQRKPCTMMVTSATLTPRAISDVKSVLSLRADSVFFSQCSIDRPNISLVVRPMLNPRKSFVDLTFLLQNWKPGDPPPPKFLVFFDSISESVEAGHYLCSLLPPEHRPCIQWFNSEMSDCFKIDETLRFANNEVWGLLATDSFGMGMDLPDIRIIVQWGATCSISTLWQRFGQCVRDPNLQGTAILFTEKENLDSERSKKADRAEKRRAKTAPKKAAKQQRTERSAAKVEEQENVNDELSGDEQKIVEERVKKPSGKLRKILDSVVDDVINAKGRGYPCRRIPIMTVFKNIEAGGLFSSPNSAFIDGDEVALHHECNSEVADGCTRCGPKQGGPCCDLHNPDAFGFIQSPVTKPIRKLPCSSIPKHTANETDIAFSHDLDSWRCSEMWDGASEYGNTILSMITKRYPVSDPPTSTLLPQPSDMWIPSIANVSQQSLTFIPYSPIVNPVASYTQSQPVPPVANTFIPHAPNVQPQLDQYALPLQPTVPRARVPRQDPTCSACRKKGHTMRSTKCELRQGKARQGQENVEPRNPGPSYSQTQYPPSQYPFEQSPSLLLLLNEDLEQLVLQSAELQALQEQYNTQITKAL